MVQSRNANARGTATRGSTSVKRAGSKISSKRGGKTGGTSKKKTKTQAAKSLRKGKKPLATMTESALQDYFGKLNGTTPGDLYDLVLSEVERPLLRTVMQYAEGNQSRAAEILGINRGTLRKKLRTYGIDVQ